MSKFRCEAVTKNYGNKVALANFTSEVPDNVVVGLIGDNGAGKSTLLKILGKVHHATSGSYTCSGETVYHSDLDQLYDWMSPKLTESMYQDLYRDFEVDKFRELVELLKIPQNAGSGMSKGQRARLRLASSLARNVDMYLLDEPLSGIDALSREKLLEAINSRKQPGKTIILSTHEVRDAQDVVDHLWILKSGELMMDEPKKNISIIDQMKEIYGD